MNDFFMDVSEMVKITKKKAKNGPTGTFLFFEHLNLRIQHDKIYFRKLIEEERSIDFVQGLYPTSKC